MPVLTRAALATAPALAILAAGCGGGGSSSSSSTPAKASTSTPSVASKFLFQPGDLGSIPSAGAAFTLHNAAEQAQNDQLPSEAKSLRAEGYVNSRNQQFGLRKGGGYVAVETFKGAGGAKADVASSVRFLRRQTGKVTTFTAPGVRGSRGVSLVQKGTTSRNLYVTAGPREWFIGFSQDSTQHPPSEAALGRYFAKVLARNKVTPD